METQEGHCEGVLNVASQSAVKVYWHYSPHSTILSKTDNHFVSVKQKSLHISVSD